LQREISKPIAIDRFATGGQRLRCFTKPEIPIRIEIKVASDEPSELCLVSQAEPRSIVSNPPMKLRTDAVKIFRLRASLALANFVGKLRAKPALDRIRVLARNVLADSLCQQQTNVRHQSHRSTSSA